MNIRTNINKIKQIENGKENFKNKKKKKKASEQVWADK